MSNEQWIEDIPGLTVLLGAATRKSKKTTQRVVELKTSKAPLLIGMLGKNQSSRNHGPEALH